MLAFIDSPLQIMVLIVVLLIVFGPQKLPEMLNQLGRAIREFKRTTSDLSNSFHMDDRYESSYNPPRYDSYGNSMDNATATAAEETHNLSAAPEIAGATASAQPHGDFAASALADTAGDYGVDSAGTSGTPKTDNTVYGIMPAGAATKEVEVRPAEGAVSRES